MMPIDVDSVAPVDGGEGSKIRQVFHPHNTMLGIRYSIVKCALGPGKKSRQHILKSSEVYYVTQGSGVLHVDEEKCQVKKDTAVYVAPHSKQFIENTGDVQLEFLCIVDPAWKKEDELVVE